MQYYIVQCFVVHFCGVECSTMYIVHCYAQQVKGSAVTVENRAGLMTSIYIPNEGVILVSPYIQRMFSENICNFNVKLTVCYEHQNLCLCFKAPYLRATTQICQTQDEEEATELGTP